MGDYGNAASDIRHHFGGYVLYDIPGSSHGPTWLSHGWQVNTNISVRTGFPFTVRASSDSSGTGENTTRANQVADPFQGVHAVVAGQSVTWINRTSFVNPASGSYGTIARNSVYGPGYASVDLSVFKAIPLRDQMRAQLRLEMFNIFTRVNLAQPGSRVGRRTGPHRRHHRRFPWLAGDRSRWAVQHATGAEVPVLNRLKPFRADGVSFQQSRRARTRCDRVRTRATDRSDTMSYVDSVLLNLTERSCRRFQLLTGRTNVWLALQLTNLSIVVYFVWAALVFWSDAAARTLVAVFCSGLLYALTQTIFKDPIEAHEAAAYRRVAKGFRNPRRVRDAQLRISFLTLSLVLFYPVLLVYTNLRLRIVLLSYSLIVLTTAVLYLLACDPLPPCVGRVRQWIRGWVPSRLAPSESNLPYSGARFDWRRPAFSYRLSAIRSGRKPSADS